MNEEEKKEYEELKSLLYTGTISQYGKRKLIDMFEKQSKEVEELKAINKMQKYRIEVIDEREFISKDKIKAKIEEYKKLINECPMNDEEIFCKECTEKCGFNQTIDVLQSLLEKE